MEQKSFVQREVVCPGAAFFKYIAPKCKQQIALAFIPDPRHAEGRRAPVLTQNTAKAHWEAQAGLGGPQ